MYLDSFKQMDCEEIYFSKHAIQRMFERSISQEIVLQIIKTGDVVSEYPDDTPFPSALLLGQYENRPLHVVAAADDDSGRCIVITAYFPDLEDWEEDFKTRRNS